MDLPAAAAVEERVTALDVPAGFDRPWVEFATAEHGYAMFPQCGLGRCEVRLFSTEDGGRTWQSRAHPQPIAGNQQMHVTGEKTVVLLSEPDAWYVSGDGGVSWERRPYREGEPPAEYPFGHDAGPFWLDCGRDNERPCVIRDRAGASRPAPGGYNVLTNGHNGTVWLTGVRGGRPITQLREMGSGVVKDIAVPEQPGRPVYAARVLVSTDGQDSWLVADQDPLGVGGGTAVMRGSVLKGTGLPLVWRLSGGAWKPEPLTGVDEKPNWPYSVAPAGRGMLIISGPEAALYFGTGPLKIAGMPRLDWITLLREGTIFGQAEAGVVYLGVGTGAERKWIKVVPSRR